MDVQRREASIEYRRKHFLMNDVEITEPTFNSPFEKPKVHCWFVERKISKRRINAVNVDGVFGVEEFAITKNVADAGGLISAA